MALLYNELKGLKRSNPMNVKHYVVNDWLGRVRTGKMKEGKLEQFLSPEMGIRAGAIILRSKHRRGIVTIDQIIPSYAPRSSHGGDNADIAINNYIKHVAKKVDAKPNQVLELGEVMSVGFISAMIEFEQGFQPFSDDMIRRSILMADI